MKNRIFSFIFLLLFPCLLFSCKKSDLQEDANKKVMTKSQTKQSKNKQKWQPTNERVAVVLGYGYNDEDFVQKARDYCAFNYGLAEDGGKIAIYVFPEDFKKGNNSILELRSLMQDFDKEAPEGTTNIKGLLTFGSPENLHTVVTKLFDQSEGICVFPVFTFFTEDAALAIESASSIVIDAASYEGEQEETQQKSFDMGFEMFCNSLNYICKMTTPTLDKSIDLLKLAQELTGTKNITRYTDAQTGLKAANHFVIE